MYQGESKSRLFLIIFLIAASLLAWLTLNKFRPMLVEAGCSEVASRSSGLLKENTNFESSFSYENVKSSCLSQSEK